MHPHQKDVTVQASDPKAASLIHLAERKINTGSRPAGGNVMESISQTFMIYNAEKASFTFFHALILTLFV